MVMTDEEVVPSLLVDPGTVAEPASVRLWLRGLPGGGGAA